MNVGFTAKMYPNKAQRELLDKHFGCARWVYNEMITINQKSYKRRGKCLTGYDMQSYLPKLKKQHPWLAEVNSQSLQIVCHNLADAYNRFFKKSGRFPKFKKRSPYGSFTSITATCVEDGRVKLPKLGKIKIRGGLIPKGKHKRLTVKRTASGYYVSILIDDGAAVPKPVKFKTIVGVDVGIKDMVVCSNGISVKAPRLFLSSQQQLRNLQRSLSRKSPSSTRKDKARKLVAILHERVKNRRKDFNHKLTRKLVNSENQAFAVESLSVKNMMKNHKLAKHIADAGWGQFLTFLKYKAEAVGKPVLVVDRFFPSSKTCSACGVVKDSLLLSVREWTCGECGALHHRDVNAAINIAQEAVRNSVFNRGGGRSPIVLRQAAAVETRTHIMCDSGPKMEISDTCIQYSKREGK